MSGVTIMLNGCTLKYDVGFTELVIDCNTWTASADGADVTPIMSGDYPEIIPGINAITITAEESGTLEIVGYPQYFYGAGGVSR